MGKPKKQSSPNAIAQNRKARFDYHLEQFFEAGLSLQGWEVKALREGRGRRRSFRARGCRQEGA